MPVKTQEVSTKDAKRTSYVELSIIYDRIYDIAGRLINKHNPCKIHTKDKKLCCIGYPTGRVRLCCGGCWDMKIDHYSLFGCTTKCLPCKLYLCPTAQHKNKTLYSRLVKLRNFTQKHLPSIYCYQSKEQWLIMFEENKWQ